MGEMRRSRPGRLQSSGPWAKEETGREDFLPSLAEGSRCGGASTAHALRVSGTEELLGAEGPTEPAPSVEAVMLSRSVGPQKALSPPRCSHIRHPGALTGSSETGKTQGFQTPHAKAPGTHFTPSRHLAARVVQAVAGMC